MAHRLRAGAASVDITPELGIQLAGDIGRKRPVEEIRERLYANALVLESGGERICIISTDLCMMTCEWSNTIRRLAADRIGIAPEAIMLHTVQNHATPSVGHCFLPGPNTKFPAEYPWLMGGDDRYNEPTVARCVEAVERAVSKIEPVTVASGRGIDGRAAFNRRFIMRDGTARCHPAPCDPEIVHVEGPSDPSVGVATFINDAGRVVAAMLHHTCHPCHGYPHHFVIGDWPGVWAANMRAHWGEGCVPLVINGCCGNIHHTDHTNPHPRHDHVEMASLLTETTMRVLDSMENIEVQRIGMRHRAVPLTKQMPDKETIAAAARLIEAHPEPLWIDAERTRVEWDWVYAVTILDMVDWVKDQPIFNYEVQVFDLGALKLVSLMGEPFVEAQLEIKQASASPHTLVAHFCNGYIGYLPTRAAFERGGYETRPGCTSKLTPDALELVTAAAIEMLEPAAAGSA